MKQLGILCISAIVAAACSSSTPPAASSDSVAQASSVPNKGPDFTPASQDGLASAPVDARRANHPTQPPPSLNPPSDGALNDAHASTDARPNGDWNNGADGSSGVSATMGNAAATPSARSQDADNSGINQRDRSSQALTPMDQGTSQADRDTTQHIRQAVMRDNNLSFTAKNVKIITINGRVTLRGPVKSEAERSAVEAAARAVAGGDRVDSQLELSK